MQVVSSDGSGPLRQTTSMTTSTNSRASAKRGRLVPGVTQHATKAGLTADGKADAVPNTEVDLGSTEVNHLDPMAPARLQWYEGFCRRLLSK